jgi:hypothetical protein
MDVTRRMRVPFALYSPAGDVNGVMLGDGLSEELGEGLEEVGDGEGLLVGLANRP